MEGVEKYRKKRLNKRDTTKIEMGGELCNKHLLTLHLEEGVLGHFFAIALHLLLDSLLVVFVRRAHDHHFTLEACKQTHLPLLAWGRQVGLGEREERRNSERQLCVVHVRKHGSELDNYMIQDVVPLLTSCNLNKFSQEKWCTLGNGGEFCDILGLPFQAIYL